VGKGTFTVHVGLFPFCRLWVTSVEAGIQDGSLAWEWQHVNRNMCFV